MHCHNREDVNFRSEVKMTYSALPEMTDQKNPMSSAENHSPEGAETEVKWYFNRNHLQAN
jgi:hypothetical protein